MNCCVCDASLDLNDHGVQIGLFFFNCVFWHYTEFSVIAQQSLDWFRLSQLLFSWPLPQEYERNMSCWEGFKAKVSYSDLPLCFKPPSSVKHLVIYDLMWGSETVPESVSGLLNPNDCCYCIYAVYTVYLKDLLHHYCTSMNPWFTT